MKLITSASQLAFGCQKISEPNQGQEENTDKRQLTLPPKGERIAYGRKKMGFESMVLKL